MPGKPSVFSSLRQEWLLAVAFATTALFLLFGKGWLADLSNPLWFALMLVWLFAVIMSSAFAVVHHAESLAIKLGEPLGTLVLTLSVIGIEVMMISSVMLTGESKPTLARDTMYGIVMIVLNGMIGVALLVGGLRHHEQEYNLQGANSFLYQFFKFFNRFEPEHRSPKIYEPGASVIRNRRFALPVSVPVVLIALPLQVGAVHRAGKRIGGLVEIFHKDRRFAAIFNAAFHNGLRFLE